MTTTVTIKIDDEEKITLYEGAFRRFNTQDLLESLEILLAMYVIRLNDEVSERLETYAENVFDYASDEKSSEAILKCADMLHEGTRCLKFLLSRIMELENDREKPTDNT